MKIGELVAEVWPYAHPPRRNIGGGAANRLKTFLYVLYGNSWWFLTAAQAQIATRALSTNDCRAPSHADGPIFIPGGAGCKPA